MQRLTPDRTTSCRPKVVYEFGDPNKLICANMWYVRTLQRSRLDDTHLRRLMKMIPSWQMASSRFRFTQVQVRSRWNNAANTPIVSNAADQFIINHDLWTSNKRIAANLITPRTVLLVILLLIRIPEFRSPAHDYRIQTKQIQNTS
jgi:hypothetical protein